MNSIYYGRSLYIISWLIEKQINQQSMSEQNDKIHENHNQSVQPESSHDQEQLISAQVVDQIMPLTDLKDLFNECKRSLDKNLEQDTPLLKVNDILQMLTSAALATEAPQIASEEQNKFIYQELIPGVAKRAVQVKTKNKEWMALVAETLSCLGNLFNAALQQSSNQSSAPFMSDLVDAMRYVFDSSKPFYQHHYQSQIVSITSAAVDGTGDTGSAVVEPIDFSKFSASEEEWRRGLKKGFTVDVKKFDEEYGISMWTKGEIMETKGSDGKGGPRYFNIRFLKDIMIKPQDIKVDSELIAPLNTWTAEESWRDNLKVGDEVDAMTKNKAWFKATVVMPDTRDAPTLPIAKIGFRQYTEMGDKSDSMGKYFGYSEGLDEYIGQHTVRLQKPGSYTGSQTCVQAGPSQSTSTTQIDTKKENPQDQSSSEKAVEEQDEADMKMLEDQPDKEVIYAVVRRRCKSEQLEHFLNKFGEAQGFDNMYRRILKMETSLEEVNYLLDCMGKSAELFHKSFVDQFFDKLIEGTQQKILNATEAQLRQVRKERIDEIVSTLYNVLSSRLFMSNFERTVRKHMFNLEIGVVFLRQKFLEKRIDGAKLLDFICKEALNGKFKQTITTTAPDRDLVGQLIGKLKEQNILEEFFSRKKCHIQLVQRSEGLLKLLISKNALTEEEFEMVWSCTLADEHIQVDFYKVISAICYVFPSDAILFFINKIVNRPLSSVRPQAYSIDLLETLCSKTVLMEHKKLGLNFLWDFTFQEALSRDDPAQVLKGVTSFSELFKSVLWETADEYFKRMADTLKERRHGYLVYKILSKYLKDFKAPPKPKEGEEQDADVGPLSVREIIDTLQAKYDLIEVVINEFSHYMAQVREQVDLAESKAAKDEKEFDVKAFGNTAIVDIFLHKDHVVERLDFLLAFVSNGSVKFGINQLSTLWEDIITVNKIVADQDLFFMWLRKSTDHALQQNEHRIVEFEDLIEFFKEKISSQTSSFVNLSLEGYYFIQSFFIMMNQRTKKLILLGEDSQKQTQVSQEGSVTKFTSYSSNSGAQLKSYSFTQDGQPKGILKNAGSSAQEAGSSTTQTGVPKEAVAAFMGTSITDKSDVKNVDPTSVEVQVRAQPDAMEGINGLWKIAIDCKDKQVGDSVTNLLLQLHTNVDFGMEELVPQFEDQYIRSCMRLISEQSSLIDARSQERKQEIIDAYAKEKGTSKYLITTKLMKVMPVEEKRIIRCLNCLQMLLANSEKDGVHGLRPHKSLHQSQNMCKIRVTSTFNGEGIQKNFDFKAYTNITIFELKKIISYQLSWRKASDGTFSQVKPMIHPIKIRMDRMLGGTYRRISNKENGCTLAQLVFQADTNLSISPAAAEAVSKVPLLNDDLTDLNGRALYLFEEIFNRIAIEDPAIPGRKIFGRAEVKTFICAATGEGGGDISVGDARIDHIIGFARNKDEKMDLEDFITFYKKSAVDKVDTVRSNLKNLGYRHDLKMIPQDGADDNIMQTRKTINDMPRYKMSNDITSMNSLFNLLDYHTRVWEDAVQLIGMLCTNTPLYWHILWLEERPEQHGVFLWSELFDESNINKLIYRLDIIDSFIQSDYSLLDPECQEYKLKSTWVQRFLQAGGFEELLKLFRRAVNESANSFEEDGSGTQVNQTKKSFLSFTVRIIHNFIMAALQANSPQMLLRKQSSIEPSPQSQQEEDKYKTPEKQVQVPFVAAATASSYGPELPPDKAAEASHITQEFLFGTDDPQDKPAEKKEESKEEEDKKKEETTALTSSLQGTDVDFQESDRFKKIVDEIKGSGTAMEVLSVIDFTELQEELFLIISEFLNYSQEYKKEDNEIIRNTLSLWQAAIVWNHSMMKGAVAWTSDKHDKIQNFRDLILAGIFSPKGITVRQSFKETIDLICEKVTEPCSGNDNALNYMLKLMMNSFPDAPDPNDKDKVTIESDHFFDLLKNLVSMYGVMIKEKKENNESTENMIDLTDLLYQTVDRIKNHPSREAPGCLFADKLQLGYLSLARELIFLFTQTAEYKEIVEFNLKSHFLDELFYENLFYVPGRTMNLAMNKCKHRDSRTAAYKLLYRYVSALKPKELGGFLACYLWPMIKDYPRPVKWRHQPSDKTRSVNAGLLNLGNICYMVSMLQQFYMVPQFRYKLMEAVDEKPEEMAEWRGVQIDDNLLKQFQKIFGFLELTGRQAYDTTGFCYAFKDFDGQPTNVGIQCDAQEFLNIFFDRIENILAPTSQKYLLQDVFRGSQVDELVCQECGFTKTRVDTFYNLSVEVKNKQNLGESLNKMLEGSEIQDYFCDGCQKKVDIKKRSLLGHTPNVLIVHLQRIVFSFDTFNNVKINSKFEFPYLLDLKKLTFKDVMNQENKADKTFEDEDLNEYLEADDDEFMYRLVGVTIHRGTADHGHYYSLINSKRGAQEPDAYEKFEEWSQPENDTTWRKFDDEETRWFTGKDIPKEAFGGDGAGGDMSNFLAAGDQNYGQSAYMLVYERRKKHAIRQVGVSAPTEAKAGETGEAVKVPEQVSAVSVDSTRMQTSEERPTTSSTEPEQPVQSAPEEKPHPEAAPQPGDEKPDEPMEPEQEKEISMVPYNKIGEFVPDWLRQMVDNDNSAFIVDRQVFHSQFFNLVKMILDNIAKNIYKSEGNKTSEDYKAESDLKAIAMQISSKTLFDFMTHSTELNYFSPMVDSMDTILTFLESYIELKNPEKESKLTDYIKQHWLNDNCKYFFDMMFESPEQSARFYVAKHAAHVFKMGFRIHGSAIDKGADPENPKIKELYRVLDECMTLFWLKLQTKECQKQWSRLLNYFTFLKDVITGGDYQTEYMLRKFDCCADIADLMLGNKSPRAKDEKESRITMGGSVNPAPFGPLVTLCAHLVRCMHTKTMLESESTADTFMRFKNQCDYSAEPTPLTNKYIMSDEATYMLTSGDFLRMVVNNNFQVEDWAQALAHLCFNNYKFSKHMAIFLLRGIGSGDYDSVKTYLEIVGEIIKVKEHEGPNGENLLQRKRLEWVFGFSFVMFVQQDDLIKFGFDRMTHSISGEVYNQRSYLSYDSNIGDESLMHLLWRYQGRMDVYTVNSLEFLATYLASDETVCEFFSDLRGYTYQYARYTDWIRPYLEKQMRPSATGYQSSCVEQVTKILSKFEIYEAYLKRKDGVEVLDQDVVAQKLDFEKVEENKEEKKEEPVEIQIETVNVDAPPKEEVPKVIPCANQPFVILSTNDETYLDMEETDGVLLSRSLIECSYVTSQPTGSSNLAFATDYLNKYTSNTSGGRSASAMLKDREQLMQEASVNKSGGFVNKLAQAKKQDAESEVIINDRDEEWENINKEEAMQQDEEDPGYKQDNEDLPQQEPQQEQQKPEPEVEVHEPQDVQMAQEQEPEQSKQIAEDNQNLDDSFENWQGAPILTCSDMVLKLTVSNTTQEPILFKIKFETPQKDINLDWPRTGLKGALDANETRVVALLTKREPNAGPIGELKAKLSWKIDASKVVQEAAKEEDTSTVKFNDKVTVADNKQTTDTGVGGDDVGYDPADFGGSGGANAFEKNCPFCTFLNPIQAEVCSCCMSNIGGS